MPYSDLMKQELKIIESRFGAFEDQLRKINKRAEKLGLGSVRCTCLRTESEPDKHRDPTGELGAVIIFHVVEVEGDEPVLQGWRFVAAIDHLVGEDGQPLNILVARPGENLEESYRVAGPDCGHCRIRRRRVRTYILRHVDGKEIQVGSSCLADFLGGCLNPEGLAVFQTEVYRLLGDNWTEESGGGFGGGNYLDLARVLEVAVAQMRIHGWVPLSRARNEAGSVATLARVSGWLSFRGSNADEKTRELHRAESPTEEDCAQAVLAREWALTLEGGTDYEHNLWVLAQVPAITWKHLGILTSLPAAYLRMREREIAIENAKKISKHFGEIGKRKTWVFQVTRINTFEGPFGTTWIVGFVDSDGNQAVWFASRNPDLQIGCQYQVKATVKSHDSYKDVSQTRLSRCVVKKG